MSKKILVIEDDPVNLQLVEFRLEKEGYEVVSARDGDIGLEKAQNEKPDLILLDVEMPNMNGYFFIAELHKEEAMKSIPIIVLTAHENMKHAFSKRQVKAYMTKPIDFDQLFAKISESIS